MEVKKIDLNRNDTKMLQSIAIISMLVLHLFCRKGDDVYGTPLLWLNKDTPFVYIFGFLSEICVPLFVFCSGYGHYANFVKNDRLGVYYKGSFIRLWRLIYRFWIICTLFSVVGLIVGDGVIPGSFTEYLKNMLMLSSSYNGAWWYMATYILLVVFSYPFLSLAEACGKKGKPLIVLLVLAVLSVAEVARQFALNRGILDAGSKNFVYVQFLNYIRTIIPYMFGAIFAASGFVGVVKDFAYRLVPKRVLRQLLVLCVFTVGSALFYVLQAPALAVFYTLFVVVMFSVLEKGRITEIALLYFGDHSTNIWLVHMFFYLFLFGGFAQSAKYSLLIFALLTSASLAASYVINFVVNLVESLFKNLKKEKI